MKKTPLTKEYLTDRFINKKWTYFEIYKETGWSKCSISLAISKFGLRKRRNLRNLNLVGEKFGKLKVISIAPKKKKTNYWNCVCDCGNKKQASTGNLLKGNTWCCGCEDKTNLKGEKHPSWLGKGKISGRYWHILQANSAKRGIYINLTIDDIWNLFIAQEEKCALTKLPITIASDSSQTASLDRIDSSKGYVKGNIQWVHKDINKMKNILSNSKFIEYCKLIALNN